MLTSSICRLQIRRRKHASGRGQIRKQCFEAWYRPVCIPVVIPIVMCERPITFRHTRRGRHADDGSLPSLFQQPLTLTAYCVVVVNPLECKGNCSATSNNMKLVHWRLLHLVQQGGHWTPRPLLAVPNVTAHPSTASLPVTVVLYTVYNGSVARRPLKG